MRLYSYKLLFSHPPCLPYQLLLIVFYKSASVPKTFNGFWKDCRADDLFKCLLSIPSPPSPAGFEVQLLTGRVLEKGLPLHMLAILCVYNSVISTISLILAVGVAVLCIILIFS